MVCDTRIDLGGGQLKKDTIVILKTVEFTSLKWGIYFIFLPYEKYLMRIFLMATILQYYMKYYVHIFNGFWRNLTAYIS